MTETWLTIFQTYFLLFLIYAFLGWVIETSLNLVLHHRFVNRGFLIGPYCPIYGFGCLFITLLLGRYASDPLALFIMSMVICAILEYTTSYIMEKIFKARWWDYSQRKFNINGRIWLGTLAPFGLLGMLVIYVFNPFFFAMIDKIPSLILNILTIVLLIIFMIDNFISFKIIFNFKKIAKNIAQDSTEEITRRVREVMKKKSVLSRRLMDAFPDMQARIKQISREIEKIKKDLIN